MPDPESVAPIAPPASDPSAPDATASTPASDRPAEKGSGLGGWLRSFVFGTDRPSDEDSEREPDQESAPTPKTLTLTEEELERRVQSETDRREAKRKTEADDAERKRLRDEDPYGYAEAEKARETEQEMASALHGVLGKAVADYDAHTVAPLLAALPEATRARLVADAPAGLEGRKALVAAAVAAIQADVEEKLRKNPAFRKQVLAGVRDTEEQPDLAPATASSGTAIDGNAMLAGLASSLGRHR